MRVAGLDAAELAGRFGTPLYVYDLDGVTRSYQRLTGILPAGCRVLYSLKANPHPDVVRHLAGLGAGADVSSEHELTVALAAGVDPHAILYTGPAPTDAEYERAAAAGVTVSVESAVALGRLQLVAGSAVRALVRVNLRPAASAITMAGGAHFGCLLDELDEMVALAATGRVELVGVHSFIGSQMSADAVVEATTIGLEAAAALTGAGVPPKIVDLGGGFAAPYATAGAAPTYAGVQARLTGLVEAAYGSGPRPDLWYESGRYLAGPAGTLLARVMDVKERDGKRFAILDAGVNHLGGMSGLGRLWRPKLTILTDGGEGRDEPTDVAGPLCTPLDILGAGVPMAPVRPGSIVAVPNVGAYGLSASLVDFLGRDAPAEVVVSGGRVVGATRRQVTTTRLSTLGGEQGLGRPRQE
jgi:diaminopimelate decarboxylase